MNHNKVEEILRKLLTGDIWIYTDGHTGAGLDYSWVDLEPEEAKYLAALADEVRGYEPL